MRLNALWLICLLLLLPGAVALGQPAPASQPVEPPATQPAATAAPGQPAPAWSEVSAEVEQYGMDPFDGLDHSGTPPLPPRQLQLPPRSAPDGERRPLPSYDGRPPASLSAGEVLIWIPRGLLYPVHLLLEYGVRWPITQGVTFAEKHYLIPRIQRLFTWSDGRAGLFPTMFFDFGLEPSVGLYFYYDDLLVKNNDLVLQFGFWPTGWYQAVATDRFKVFRNDAGTVTLRGEFVYRPDFVYTGLGVDSVSTEHFFRFRKVEAEASLRAALKDLNRVTFGLRYRNGLIGGSDLDDDDPSVDSAGSPWVSDLPRQVPGYDKTYNLLSTQLKVELDTRSPDRVFTPGSGLRLELFGSFNIDPGNTELAFVRYGAEAVAFLDLTGLNHVLALRVYAELLETIGDDLVPITERIELGGAEHMRGYLQGWLRGDSALVFTLDYRYPVWTFLDANIFVSLGNAFTGRYELLHAKHLLLNWGIGLRSNTSRDVSFDILVAFGSNQLGAWDEDFRINHVRAVFGINQGF